MIGRMWLASLVSCGLAIGQAPAPKDAAPAKQLAFDVVSIRQNLASPDRGLPQFGPTQDGYHAANSPMVLFIITAYLPTTGAAAFMPDQISGMPDWATRDSFAIDARVAEEDLQQWQKHDEQPAMLRSMMQALLEERCKMVVHREVKEVPVYSLVVGKNGPKFKPTNPDEKHEGMKLPFGGTLVPGPNSMTLYAAPMSSLAALMSSMGRFGASRPIQDKTGLTGLYDIVLSQSQIQVAGDRPSSQDASAASDPGGNNVAAAMADALGLKLESTKAPVETLVIDHIEPPTAN